MATIKNITLETTVTETQDIGGFRFFVKEGDLFDAGAYAESYNLNIADIDDDSIKAAQDKAGGLCPGQWLEVSHEVEFFEEEDASVEANFE